MKYKNKYKINNKYFNLQNLAISIIKNKNIITTIKKAKHLQKFIKIIINNIKKNKTNKKKKAFNIFKNKTITNILYKIINKYTKKNSGYTSIHKIKYRKSDMATLAYIKFIN